MKNLKLLLLCILSGLLLWLSFPPDGVAILSLLAWIPLFATAYYILINKLKRPFLKGMAFSFTTFIIWNILTTWWIWNSTPEGAILALLLNSLFMSILFGFWLWSSKYFFFTKLKFIIPVAFIALWCSFEYLHLNWDISWPWLNLGNLFASQTELVQWYEYTGTFGGTIWILLINVLLFFSLVNIKSNKKSSIAYLIISITIIVITISVSYILYYCSDNKRLQTDNNSSFDAIIVQQNSDPWQDEYQLSNTEHIANLINLIVPGLGNKTSLIVCSESAIPHNVSEDKLLNKSYSTDDLSYCGFDYFDSLFKYYPNLNVIAGVSTYRLFNSKTRSTVREVPNYSLLREFYNSSMLINKEGVKDFYHKSKLVPGVEIMPYPEIFGFLEKFAINLGGITGSLAKDSVQKTFSINVNDKKIKIGAPICYESIFGSLFANFVKNGAQVMCVITNDGWWKETQGYQQHFLYSKLRAVETRKTILRAANTGTSAIIDPRGNVHFQTDYNTQTIIKNNIFPNNYTSFYVKHGDLLAHLALIVSAIYALLLVIKIFSQSLKTPL